MLGVLLSRYTKEKKTIGIFLKLSTRLMQINNMVDSRYTHIWDCCCDHGFLGSALVARKAANKVHFVDIVPQLITSLDAKLNDLYSSTTWETHCIDVTSLPLNNYEGKHLIIIAGIGGDLMIKLIKALYQKHSDLSLDFLLCPVHHQYALRETLINLKFGMIQEALIEDNRRFYEIILVSTRENENQKISVIGDNLWLCKSPNQTDLVKRYLNKTLTHYRRMHQGGRHNVQHIINAYSTLQSNQS